MNTYDNTETNYMTQVSIQLNLFKFWQQPYKTSDFPWELAEFRTWQFSSCNKQPHQVCVLYNFSQKPASTGFCEKLEHGIKLFSFKPTSVW